MISVRVRVMSAGEADTEHDGKADQHSKELDNAMAAIMMLGAEKLEEDHVKDDAGGQCLQDPGGQEVVGLVIVAYQDTNQHTQWGGEREDAHVEDNKAYRALGGDKLFTNTKAHDHLVSHDGGEDDPDVARCVLKRDGEPLEHRVYGQR